MDCTKMNANTSYCVTTYCKLIFAQIILTQESPPLVRNSPLVAGAITWSRALLKKIEDPMKIFKENKFVTSYRVRN